MDIYLPSGEGPHAAVLVIRGGGWTPSENQEENVPMVLATAGFAVFVPDYSPAGRAIHPTQVEELQEAVRWLRLHAEDYAVDPERVAAMGSSAGGHLAALLGALGEGSLSEGARIRAVVSWSGPMDLNRMVCCHHRRQETFFKLLGCSSPEECEPAARDASPISHLDPTDAPMFLAHGTEERIPFEQAAVMADALEGNGIPYDLVPVSGSQHGNDLQYRPGVLEESIEFLRRWLNVSGNVAGPAGSPLPVAGGSERDQTERDHGGTLLGWVLLAAALVALLGVVFGPRLARRLRG